MPRLHQLEPFAQQVALATLHQWAELLDYDLPQLPPKDALSTLLTTLGGAAHTALTAQERAAPALAFYRLSATTEDDAHALLGTQPGMGLGLTILTRRLQALPRKLSPLQPSAWLPFGAPPPSPDEAPVHAFEDAPATLRHVVDLALFLQQALGDGPARLEALGLLAVKAPRVLGRLRTRVWAVAGALRALGGDRVRLGLVSDWAQREGRAVDEVEATSVCKAAASLMVALQPGASFDQDVRGRTVGSLLEALSGRRDVWSYLRTKAAQGGDADVLSRLDLLQPLQARMGEVARLMWSEAVAADPYCECVQSHWGLFEVGEFPFVLNFLKGV